MRVSEREFQGWLLDVAARFGWRAWHVPTPMRPVAGGKFVPDPRGAGLPDLVLIHTDPPRLVFAELKAKGGTLSAGQHEFLELARAVAEEVRDTVLGMETAEPGTTDGTMLGVYVWQSGMEDAIEALLRSKVLT